MHKTIKPTFSDSVKLVWDGDASRATYGRPSLIALTGGPTFIRPFLDAVEKYSATLDTAILHLRDYDLTHSGAAISEMEGRYLDRKDGRILEGIQHVYMRVALALNLDDVAEKLQASSFSMCLSNAAERDMYDTIIKCALAVQNGAKVGIAAQGIPCSGRSGKCHHDKANVGLWSLMTFLDGAVYFARNSYKEAVDTINITVEPWHRDVRVCIEFNNLHQNDLSDHKNVTATIVIPEIREETGEPVSLLVIAVETCFLVSLLEHGVDEEAALGRPHPEERVHHLKVFSRDDLQTLPAFLCVRAVLPFFGEDMRSLSEEEGRDEEGERDEVDGTEEEEVDGTEEEDGGAEEEGHNEDSECNEVDGMEEEDGGTEETGHNKEEGSAEEDGVEEEEHNEVDSTEEEEREVDSRQPQRLLSKANPARLQKNMNFLLDGMGAEETPRGGLERTWGGGGVGDLLSSNCWVLCGGGGRVEIRNDDDVGVAHVEDCYTAAPLAGNCMSARADDEEWGADAGAVLASPSSRSLSSSSITWGNLFMSASESGGRRRKEEEEDEDEEEGERRK
ncbi:hypothetical protein C8R43DRAFT_944466 [Mycena crocata]|nr:hypothetical protein C8R43DRAFT_944466 [Mycena crocata]